MGLCFATLRGMTPTALDEAFAKVQELAATFKASEARYLSCDFQEAEDKLISDEEYVYPRDLVMDSDRWQRGQTNKPMIDFPWEPDDRVSRLHRGLLLFARHAAQQAKRIHFIGLAGHHLMRHSLCRIFKGMVRETFANKRWFVATKESDPERTFWNLCDCFLPDELAKDAAWRRQNLKPEPPVGDFENWMYRKPHHSPMDA